MSSSNATLYYTAIDEMFKELVLETSMEEQVESLENEMPLSDTPKRIVRLRQHSLFARGAQDYVICRRMPLAGSKIDAVPSTLDLRKELHGNQILQQRRERWEAEQKKPMRRLTMRL